MAGTPFDTVFLGRLGLSCFSSGTLSRASGDVCTFSVPSPPSLASLPRLGRKGRPLLWHLLWLFLFQLQNIMVLLSLSNFRFSRFIFSKPSQVPHQCRGSCFPRSECRRTPSDDGLFLGISGHASISEVLAALCQQPPAPLQSGHRVRAHSGYTCARGRGTLPAVLTVALFGRRNNAH